MWNFKFFLIKHPQIYRNNQPFEICVNIGVFIDIFVPCGHVLSVEHCAFVLADSHNKTKLDAMVVFRPGTTTLAPILRTRYEHFFRILFTGSSYLVVTTFTDFLHIWYSLFCHILYMFWPNSPTILTPILEEFPTAFGFWGPKGYLGNPPYLL